MATCEEFTNIYRAAGVPASLRGCRDGEICDLEAQYNVTLPSSFVAYLRVMGHDTDWLFRGTDTSPYHLTQLREWAEGLLAENGVPFTLHPQDFVFLMHQGYQFMWFRADGSSDDPPVFYYFEGYDAPQRRHESFTEFLLSCIRRVWARP